MPKLPAIGRFQTWGQLGDDLRTSGVQYSALCATATYSCMQAVDKTSRLSKVYTQLVPVCSQLKIAVSCLLSWQLYPVSTGPISTTA